jgi:putative hydrolase of the HAD superfamily
MLRYLLCDLDNTLYPPDNGLWHAIGRRIDLYMIERLGYHPNEVSRKRDDYLNAFGTTLNALRHHYGIDPSEFLAYVHELPLQDYLRSAPELERMLGRLPLRKVIFTNADALHAERVLGLLGIAHHFEQIFDIHALGFQNKPDKAAYLKVLRTLSAEPQECLFIDDSPTNLAPARAMGMITILVGDGKPHRGVDYQIRRITDLEDLLDAQLLIPRNS